MIMYNPSHLITCVRESICNTSWREVRRPFLPEMLARAFRNVPFYNTPDRLRTRHDRFSFPLLLTSTFIGPITVAHSSSSEYGLYRLARGSFSYHESHHALPARRPYRPLLLPRILRHPRLRESIISIPPQDEALLRRQPPRRPVAHGLPHGRRQV